MGTYPGGRRKGARRSMGKRYQQLSPGERVRTETLAEDEYTARFIAACWGGRERRSRGNRDGAGRELNLDLRAHEIRQRDLGRSEPAHAAAGQAAKGQSGAGASRGWGSSRSAHCCFLRLADRLPLIRPCQRTTPRLIPAICPEAANTMRASRAAPSSRNFAGISPEPVHTS